MESDLYYEGRWFKLKVISTQSRHSAALRLLHSLTDDEVIELLATFSILEQGIRRGRNFAGRTRKVRGSKAGLIALRASPPGRRGQQLVFFVLVRDETVWIVDGFRQTSADIRRFIARAETKAREWEATREPRPRKSPNA